MRGHAFGLISRPGSPLQVNTDIGSAPIRELSVEVDARGSVSILSPTQWRSVPRDSCDGWCGYDLIPRATVVSVDSLMPCG